MQADSFWDQQTHIYALFKIIFRIIYWSHLSSKVLKETSLIFTELTKYFLVKVINLCWVNPTSETVCEHIMEVDLYYCSIMLLNNDQWRTQQTRYMHTWSAALVRLDKSWCALPEHLFHNANFYLYASQRKTPLRPSSHWKTQEHRSISTCSSRIFIL